MVCVDASHDPTSKFIDLLKLLHGARSKYGIRVETFSHNNDPIRVDKFLDGLRPGRHDLSPLHYITFKLHYPEPDTPPSDLVYTKLTLTGNEPIELVERARGGDHFPHDPTSD